MYKLEPIQSANLKKYKYLKDPGNFNHKPKPLRKITVSDFIHVFNEYAPDYLEFRQLLDLKKNKVVCVQIFWFWNNAIMIEFPDDWTCDDKKLFGIKYKKRLKYYLIGCNHEWEEMGQQESRQRGIEHWGMCWHNYICKKCGMKKSHDSSG